MDQNGRVSQAEKETVNISLSRQSPPEELTEAEVKIWTRVVGAMRPDWFSPENLDLLAQYCAHCATAQELRVLLEDTTDPKDLKDLYKLRQEESRVMMALATKMRLTQQSTIDKERRKESRAAGRRPWEK
jgi:hypothetical protein